MKTVKTFNVSLEHPLLEWSVTTTDTFVIEPGFHLNFETLVLTNLPASDEK